MGRNESEKWFANSRRRSRTQFDTRRGGGCELPPNQKEGGSEPVRNEREGWLGTSSEIHSLLRISGVAGVQHLRASCASGHVSVVRA